MEWLAGGRMPSWASPYSAQATAALKAQFPTQWPTIRDYGVAHPEIVCYMNAYAPEDAKIAYSLVEGIGWRGLVSSGNGIIKTTLKPASGITYGAHIIATQYNQPEMSVFGSRTSNDTNTFLLQIMSQQWRTQSFAGWTLYGSAALNTLYDVRFNYKGIWVNGSQVASGNYNPTSAMSDIWLGVNNSGGSPHGAYFLGMYGDFYRLDANGNKTNWIVPFMRNGTAEMMDVVTGQLQTRTGSFTISETPAS